MKRHCTVGERRFKVWVLSTGEIRIDDCIVEFDSPSEEWMSDPARPWGKKAAHNKADKTTGRCNYTQGGNKQIFFGTIEAAREYKAILEKTPIEVRKSWFPARQ